MHRDMMDADENENRGIEDSLSDENELQLVEGAVESSSAENSCEICKRSFKHVWCYTTVLFSSTKVP